MFRQSMKAQKSISQLNFLELNFLRQKDNHTNQSNIQIMNLIKQSNANKAQSPNYRIYFAFIQMGIAPSEFQ
jgi:hypothetical protein